MDHQRRSEEIKNAALSLGFDLCGIAKAESIGRSEYLRFWLDSGRAGSMTYLHRTAALRNDPRTLLEGARSVIVVALLYHQTPPESELESLITNVESQPRGRAAMYAWGEDYHLVIRDKLEELANRLREIISEPFEVRPCVDTAPLLEREIAAAAGVGWIGKNTMVLHPRLGSYFFLGALVTTLALEPDDSIPDHCGTCTACLDACPTRAFPKAYEMDASRCISYLTIEHRGEIDPSFHEAMGDWVFGCDICQGVCPHNRDAPTTTEPRFAVREPGPRPLLNDVLSWSAEDYQEKVRGSAMKRAKLEMLQRNVRIALANAGES